MSGVSIPITRPSGRALVIGSASSRTAMVTTLQQLGYACAESESPYAAMAELCRRPLAYRAIILSLAGLYREELAIIPAIKRRFSHVDIWLSQTDGRAASLAEATRMGADGLLADDGLHRFAGSSSTEPTVPTVKAAETRPTTRPQPQARPGIDKPPSQPPQLPEEQPPGLDDIAISEPVLTADELRALLQDTVSSSDDTEGQ